MPTIKVELSSKNIAKIKNYYTRVMQILSSRELLEYLVPKIQEILNNVTARSLNSGEYSHDSNKYRGNHKVEIKDDKIQVYNKTILDQSQLMGEFAESYPNGFNLSKAVEYGVGYQGSQGFASTIASNDWQYDINNHGVRGWIYKDDNGNIHRTNGWTGALIFYKTKQEVMEKVPSWIREYVNKKLGGEFK